MKGRLIFDLTSSWSWSRPAVGVIRTERELARALMQDDAIEVLFCIYLKSLDIWVGLSEEQVQLSLDGARVPPAGQGAPSQLSVVAFAAEDCYLSVGLDWDDKNLGLIYRKKKAVGFKVALFCHDIIAIRQPHLCLERVAQKFPVYIYQLAWCADIVFCNSKSTADDLRGYLYDIKARQPLIQTVRLGITSAKIPDCAPSQRIDSLVNQRFVLYVSTIEARKNHLFLLKAYLQILEGMVDAPKLVCVGVPAWGSEPFFKLLNSVVAIKEQVMVLEEVNDEDLEHLYRNCMFTVYPSICEGWGLPIVESLARGKFCIASNTTSMPEAGGDLCEYLDPFDQQSWQSAILQHCSDDNTLRIKEQLIKSRFESPTWNSAGKEIWREICEADNPIKDFGQNVKSVGARTTETDIQPH